MSWLLRKVDSLTAAVLAAVCGTGLSQAQAFAHQYLQRLGGHRDEAERAWRMVEQSVGATVEATGQRLASEAQARFQDLAQAYDAIREAAPLLKPVALARHLSPALSWASNSGLVWPSWIGVAITPGATALTRIPSPTNSLARARVSVEM